MFLGKCEKIDDLIEYLCGIDRLKKSNANRFLIGTIFYCGVFLPSCGFLFGYAKLEARTCSLSNEVGYRRYGRFRRLDRVGEAHFAARRLVNVSSHLR